MKMLVKYMELVLLANALLVYNTIQTFPYYTFF